MATKKKMLQAAAGNVGGAGLDVEEVFSTYLYDGTDGTQSIVNGVDLSNEGGLVWVKNRGFTVGGTTGITESHRLFDTERGVGTQLLSNTDGAAQSATNFFSSFNSDGFTVGQNINNGFDGGHRYASWTFRKAPKFFDVVTYTGNGGTQTISHNLGSAPAFIVIKRTDSTGSWICYHSGLGADKQIFLDLTQAANTNTSTWQNTTPTDSVFYLGNNGFSNASGATYIAYLFAHNDGDGEFGADADADIIKCGSFTTDGSGLASVDLGFEPQWILIRPPRIEASWIMIDTMRGMAHSDLKLLLANSTSSELDWTDDIVPTATGFDVVGNIFNQNTDVIYIAIRRGPLAPPESGTEVFDVDAQNGGSFVNTPFPVDLQINKNRTFASGAVAISRLTGGRALDTSSTGTEGTVSYFEFDHQNGIEDNYQGIDGCIYWSWKRAPNFFDVVTYTGDDAASQTVPHNLGVAPEMMIVKSRSITASWFCYHKDIGNTKTIYLNSTNAAKTASSGYWNNTTPTETSFTVGVNPNQASWGGVISYLFATLAGVSKVGSYTGNGSSQTINCGFTSGARFILIKRTDSTGDWYIWDTERGIVAGNDPHLSLNTTAAEVTSDDSIDPDSSGFIVNQVAATNINVSSASYIFYSVA